MSQPTPPVGPPLQASSPTHLPTGVTVPRQTPAPVGGSGQFSVDLQRAPQAIKELRAAAQELENLLQEAQLLGKVNPPAQDPTSLDAATMLGATASGGQGSLVEAISLGLDQVRALIDGLEKDLSSYGTTEETVSSSLGRNQVL